MVAETPKKVEFTKHAYAKFELLRKYGFDISRATVEEAVASPHFVRSKGRPSLSAEALGPRIRPQSRLQDGE